MRLMKQFEHKSKLGQTPHFQRVPVSGFSRQPSQVTVLCITPVKEECHTSYCKSLSTTEEAALPTGKGAGLEIPMSRVQVPH